MNPAYLDVRFRFEPPPAGLPECFGMVAEQARVLELGRDFRQEAAFWIESGTVHLCSCTDETRHVVGIWREPATHP